MGPIHSTHISADAPLHGESESVLAFMGKCLAPPIIEDSRPQLSILGFFTTDIRKFSTTSFLRFICIYQPPCILSIAPFHHAMVERLRHTCPGELHTNKKVNKKINADKQVWLLRSRPRTSLLPFVFNRKHSFTLIYEDRIVARAFKIDLSEAHSMASKSRF